jgi:hypothetical protein
MSAVQTTQIADLLPYILPKVPTAPLPFVEFQARLAAIEFCERTRCWRHITTVQVSAQNRTIIAPPSATIHEFEEATIDGLALSPTQFIDAEPDELTGKGYDGSARYIAQINPGQIAVYPFQTGTLRVSCFLKPRHGQSIGGDFENPLNDNLNVLPQFMVTQYASSLAAGALARILETEGAEFFSPQMAAKYRADFDEACRTHFSANMRGQQRAPARVKPRWM